MVSEGTAPTADAGLGLSVRTGHEVTLPPEQAGPGRLARPPALPTGPDGTAAGAAAPDRADPADLAREPGVPGASDVVDESKEADEEPDPSRHRTADAAARLFRLWTEGDAAACTELVSLLTPSLWHTARAYRLDRATAEDVVQNAWLALARRRDQVRDPQAVMAWLLVTVRRDAARSAASARTSVDDPGPVLAASPDPAPGPAAVVVEQEGARRLWQAVGRLSERCQRLLRVVAFSDRPDYATLSVDLGMPLGSIGPTRGRCLKKLREDLGDEGRWQT